MADEPVMDFGDPPLDDGGFLLRRGELDESSGWVGGIAEPGGVTLTQSVYGVALGTATAAQRLTPDEALELSGLLERLALAVRAYHNEEEPHG